MAGTTTETVYFYYVPQHQYSNRTYYIGTSWSSYLITSVANVKVSNLEMKDILVPYTTNIEHANIIKIGYRYYDVTSVDDMSNVSTRNIRFGLEFNPVSTFITTSSSLAGYWEYTPTSHNYNTKINFSDATYKESRRQALPYLTHASIDDYKIYYYQVSSKYRKSTATDGELTLYGGFLLYDDNIFTNSDTTDSYWLISRVQTSPAVYLPNLNLYELVSKFDEYTGIPSDSIINVSISPRCPYDYTQISTATPAYGFNLKDTDGNQINALSITSGTTILRSIYELNQSDVKHSTGSAVTINLSDYERYCGRVSIVDEYNNMIAEIPTDYFDSFNNLTLNVNSISDITGIYTIITMGSIVYTIPEGQLPWVGDNWTDYVSRSLEYDRSMMYQNLKDLKATHELNQMNTIASTATNAGFAVLMAGMGGASSLASKGAVVGGTGAGIAGGIISYLAEEEQYKNQKKSIKAKQAINEKAVKSNPSVNFQTSYGLDYLYKGFNIGGMSVVIELPSNYTESDFNNHVALFGYPCFKYCTHSMATPGYIQGNCISQFTSGSYTGIEIEQLRKALADGCWCVQAVSP